MQTVKKNPSYVCDDINAKHTNVLSEPGSRDDCDDTNAKRANISTEHKARLYTNAIYTNN